MEDELGQCECLDERAKEFILSFFTLDDIEHENLKARIKSLARTPEEYATALEVIELHRPWAAKLQKAIKEMKVCSGSKRQGK